MFRVIWDHEDPEISIVDGDEYPPSYRGMVYKAEDELPSLHQMTQISSKVNTHMVGKWLYAALSRNIEHLTNGTMCSISSD